MSDDPRADEAPDQIRVPGEQSEPVHRQSLLAAHTRATGGRGRREHRRHPGRHSATRDRPGVEAPPVTGWTDTDADPALARRATRRGRAARSPTQCLPQPKRRRTGLDGPVVAGAWSSHSSSARLPASRAGSSARSSSERVAHRVRAERHAIWRRAVQNRRAGRCRSRGRRPERREHRRHRRSKQRRPERPAQHAPKRPARRERLGRGLQERERRRDLHPHEQPRRREREVDHRQSSRRPELAGHGRRTRSDNDIAVVKIAGKLPMIKLGELQGAWRSARRSWR